MSALQVIFDEVNKNETTGMNLYLPPPTISNDMMHSILENLGYDADSDTYLSQFSEILQILRYEQQHVFDLLDGYLYQFLDQMKHQKETPSTTPPSLYSPPSLSSSTSSLPSSTSSLCPCPLPHLSHSTGATFPPFPHPMMMMKTNMMITAPQKKRQNFSREITNILTQWLYTHCDHPYPSEHEKSVLCQLTGLSLSQVSGWFINARRRKLKKVSDEQGGGGGHGDANGMAVGGYMGCDMGMMGMGMGMGMGVAKNEIALNMVGDNMDFDF